MSTEALGQTCKTAAAMMRRSSRSSGQRTVTPGQLRPQRATTPGQLRPQVATTPGIGRAMRRPTGRQPGHGTRSPPRGRGTKQHRPVGRRGRRLWGRRHHRHSTRGAPGRSQFVVAHAMLGGRRWVANSTRAWDVARRNGAESLAIGICFNDSSAVGPATDPTAGGTLRLAPT